MSLIVYYHCLVSFVGFSFYIVNNVWCTCEKTKHSRVPTVIRGTPTKYKTKSANTIGLQDWHLFAAIFLRFVTVVFVCAMVPFCAMFNIIVFCLCFLFLWENVEIHNFFPNPHSVYLQIVKGNNSVKVPHCSACMTPTASGRIRTIPVSTVGSSFRYYYFINY